MTTLNGSFEVTSWDERAYDERDGRRLTKASVKQRFSGAVSGAGSVEWLMSYSEDATARFVGLQLVDGEIAGRRVEVRTAVATEPRGVRINATGFHPSLAGLRCIRGYIDRMSKLMSDVVCHLM